MRKKVINSAVKYIEWEKDTYKMLNRLDSWLEFHLHVLSVRPKPFYIFMAGLVLAFVSAFMYIKLVVAISNAPLISTLVTSNLSIVEWGFYILFLGTIIYFSCLAVSKHQEALR